MSGKLRFFVVLIYLGPLGWLATYSVKAQAQTEGNNTVYNSSMNLAPSNSFVDASMFLPPNSTTQAADICDAIYGIITNAWLTWGKGGSYPASGTVIDARGVRGTTNLTCTLGSPWTEGSTTVNVPSTILLPATGGATPTPIIIRNSSPWILPSNTHLIGEGDGTSGGSTSGTTIQAASGFSGTMIQFGSSSPVCPSSGCSGISVENLTLDGQGPLGQTVSGIANAYSQDGSYVDHVSLYQILGTGLAVSGNANNSGPYSNITFDTGGSPGLPGTVCGRVAHPFQTQL